MSTVPPQVMREALYDHLGGRRIREYGDWQNRSSPGPWDAHGVMHHWTASTGSWRSQRALLANGYPGLPGPLCHFSPSRDGHLELIGWGNCNHAGFGDSRVLQQVIPGDYRGSPPGVLTDVNGNPSFYGLEYQYHPSQGPMPDEQVQTGILAAVAIADAHSWKDPRVVAGSNLDHFEWTDRKIDRERYNLAERTRNGVQRVMINGPEQNGDDMRMLLNLNAPSETVVGPGETASPVFETEWADKDHLHPGDGKAVHPKQTRQYLVSIEAGVRGPLQDVMVSLGEFERSDGYPKDREMVSPRVTGQSVNGSGWSLVTFTRPVRLQKKYRYPVLVRNDGPEPVSWTHCQLLISL